MLCAYYSADCDSRAAFLKETTTFQKDMTTLKTRADVLTLLVQLSCLAFDKVGDEVLF